MRIVKGTVSTAHHAYNLVAERAHEVNCGEDNKTTTRKLVSWCVLVPNAANVKLAEMRPLRIHQVRHSSTRRVLRNVIERILIKLRTMLHHLVRNAEICIRSSFVFAPTLAQQLHLGAIFEQKRPSNKSSCCG